MYLDLIIAIPILWGMLRGFKRGLIIELCTLMALIMGAYGAAAFGNMAGDYLQTQFNTDPRMSLVLAFATVFILIVVAVFIFGKVLEGLIKMVALGLVNRLFGLLFGALKFGLIVSSLFFILNGFPITEKLISPKWKQESLLYKPIASIAPMLFPILHDRSWLDEIENRLNGIKEQFE